MEQRAEQTDLREVVGVFHDHDQLLAAADELMTAGFDRSALSLLAGQDTIEKKLGHLYRKVSELEDDPTVPREAYVPDEELGAGEGALVGGFLYVGATAATGAVVASGGTLATVIAAAAVAGGVGALIGTVLAALVGEHHADYLHDQLQKGGFLLWVRTGDGDAEARAKEILGRHLGEDVHAHVLTVPAAWRDRGPA